MILDSIARFFLVDMLKLLACMISASIARFFFGPAGMFKLLVCMISASMARFFVGPVDMIFHNYLPGVVKWEARVFTKMRQL